MAKQSLTVLCFLMICALFFGCSGKKTTQKSDSAAKVQIADHSTHPGPVAMDTYMVELVDNFLIIADASGSKFRPYNGQIRMKITKDLIKRFNEKVPARPLKGGLRRYGFEAGAFSTPTSMLYDFGTYRRAEYAKSVDTLRWAAGKSPMDLAINAGTQDLRTGQGYLAAIIFSDGNINDDDPELNDVIAEMEDNQTLNAKYLAITASHIMDKLIMEMDSDPRMAANVKQVAVSVVEARNNPDRINMALANNREVAARMKEIDNDPVIAAKVLIAAASLPNHKTILATKHMKDTYGDRICIYTVQIGNSPFGKSLMEQIARIGGCGYAVTSDFLASDKNMAEFVHDVFTRGTPRIPVERVEKCRDQDGDGVCDEDDECPDTPVGARVDERGCWILDKVQFDLNKWNIKPMYFGMLDEIAEVLINNPHVKMEVHGHTCTIWTEQYNMKLSHWRALSVTSYLLKRGVPSHQLAIKGFGYHQPFASNRTEEGRIQNRRVEFHPSHR